MAKAAAVVANASRTHAGVVSPPMLGGGRETCLSLCYSRTFLKGNERTNMGGKEHSGSEASSRDRKFKQY